MEYKAVLEESVMQKGVAVTAGSAVLEGLIAPCDAEVVVRLCSAGVKIVGRVRTSEFGIGGLFGCDASERDAGVAGLLDGALLTEVIDDSEKVSFVAENTGNRSGYSAVKSVAVTSAVDAVASGFADFALCNDFTGSIGRAAGAAGLCYLQPSYGSVSRYGLVPSVSSIDQIGVLCKTPKVGIDVLDVIAGYDPKDGIMMPDNRTEEPSPCSRTDEPSPCSAPVFRDGEAGTCFVPCFPCLQVLQVLCCGEFSNNINRYDGIKFGHRAKEYSGLGELYKKSRTEGFGEDVKLAAMIGAVVLDQSEGERYYDKAMKIRRVMRDAFEFDKYDVIKSCCPTLSRMCGLPALTTAECTYIAGPGREDVLKVIANEL